VPIPGVPTLQPVELPRVSPQQAGRAGQTIAGLGEDVEEIAGTSFALQAHIKEAQKHVDTLAARNQLDAAFAQLQGELAKTQNSRDVPDVLKQGQDTLNDISKQWSKSPAAVSIQMDADSLHPSMMHVGQVRQIDLMGKEFQINLAQQGEQFAKDYASSRAVGDQDGENNALTGFTRAVQGGVSTGLMGPVGAADTVRKFREQGQELQIRNAISNPDPRVNQAIYDKINSDPKAFPDVTAEQLDALKTHAQSAVESHIRYQEWAEGQMAQNTMLRPLINKWTNPATQQFDEDKALGDVTDQFSSGKITARQSQVLSEDIKSFAADKTVATKKQADQFDDGIIKMFHDRDYSKADAALEQMRPWLEQNGLGERYKSLMNYGDSQRREERVEARYERTEAKEEVSQQKQQVKEQSSSTLAQTINRFSQGYVATDTDLDSMAGEGPGKMSTADVAVAKKYSHDYQNSPSFKGAVDTISYSLGLGALPRNATAEQKASFAKDFPRQAQLQADTYSRFLEEKNKHPEKDPMVVAQEVLKPAMQKQISARLDQIFGPEQEPTRMDVFKGAVRSLFGLAPSAPSAAPQEKAPAPTTIRVREKATGRTGTVPAAEFDDKLYEKVQ
jgi:hypothetical protein